MLTARTITPDRLSDGETAAWRGMCAATGAFASPLLGPDFARLVGEVRDDARVAVLRRGETPAGFLAFHARPGGFARPIGATFSDYHALITWPEPGFDGAAALSAANIGAYRFSGLIDPHGLFPVVATVASQPGYVIDRAPDAAAFETRMRGDNVKRHRNLRRLAAKLEREHGELTLVADDPSRDAFDMIVGWKRRQYRRTGAHDVCRSAWARELLARAFDLRDGETRGVMITLRAGQSVVAGHFGLVAGGVFHSWISAINPETTACGPGMVMLTRLHEAMETLNLSAFDMGPSHDHYKSPFASRTLSVGEGQACAGHQLRLPQPIEHAMAHAPGATTLARMRRRLDHIAAAELSLGGRARGVVEAIAGFRRRQDHLRMIGPAAGAL